MELFLVIIRGAVSEILYGVYSSNAKALEAAKIVKEEEPDEYHTIIIYSTFLDEVFSGEDESIYFKGTSY